MAGAMEEKANQIPVLRTDEVGVVEKLLGSGGFCEVSAVRWIKLTPLELPLGSDELNNARGRLAKMFEGYEEKHHSPKKSKLSGNSKKLDILAQTPPRVALKKVQSSLEDERYQIGVKDLVAEASVLAKCSHPNIITLYAVGCDNNEDLSSSESSSIPRINFAIIDQLKSTLRKKMLKWKEAKGVGPIIFKSKQMLDDLWLERMVVVKNVAGAIQYLHSKGFVHRDITPDNIGFADDNVVKLFDFGLAKSIGRDGQNNDATSDGGVDCDNDQTFDLSSNTGTLRYMSPEVALGMPYGFKVDVYSFSLVIYEILNLVKPFSKIREPSAFCRMVFKGDFRPTLDDDLPQTMQNLLRRMWSGDFTVRPSSKEVAEYLEGLFLGDEFDLFPPGHFSWRERLIEGCDRYYYISLLKAHLYDAWYWYQGEHYTHRQSLASD